MSEKVENIGKKDIAWSYASTFFTIGAGVILLPFILNKMPQDTVGIWNIFQTITALVLMLDFGFRPSFARNVSYIFSGVKVLQKEGVAHAEVDAAVDYSLLKGALIAMRRFYQWVSLAAFILLGTAGTIYFNCILQKYTGDQTDAMIAWILLITINCYNLYTFYYSALLTGKGYVKRAQQINLVGQLVYLCSAIALIYAGFGLTAIVGSQLLSVIINRSLSYRTFYTTNLKVKLATVHPQDPKTILSAITPNAIKIGLTHLGGFAVNRSAILLGSVFLTLEEIACYGITIQVLSALALCASVLYQSYIPKLSQYRVENNISMLRRHYILCACSLWLVFIVGALVWVGFGNWALEIIHSHTMFVPTTMLLVMIAIGALEQNHVIAAGFITTDNRIPFFIPSLVSGAATIVLLFLFLSPLHMGIWGMILAPGIAQLAYQNWKWPSVVIKELFVNSKK